MSKRQKYWLFTAAEVAVIALVVWVLPELNFWQCVLLGGGFGIYAILVEAEHKL